MFSKNNDKTISYVAFAFVYGYNENEMTVTNAELNILATGYVTKQSEDSKDDSSVSAGNDSDDDTEVDNYVDYEVLSESVDKTKPFMQTSSEYDSTGNYVTAETNEQGSTTHYVYDINGDVTSVTDSDDNVTSYTYDSSDNLTSVKNGDSENLYTYSGVGSISKITHNGFDYSFNYDIFYNLVSTKIGNVTVASHTYDSDGNLTKTAYANGDFLEYAYDNYGNISVITGETGKIAEMIYNKQGLITKTVDYSSGETSYYYYTFDGSLESEYRTSSDGSLTHYIVTDSDGNTVEKTSVNGQTKTITSGTDKDGKSFVSNDGVTNETSTDDFGRTTQVRTVRSGGKLVFDTDYEYANGKAENSTTNLVSKYSQSYGSDSVLSYDYSYDANGNITEIKQNGKLTNKYVYDSLNELKEEYDYVNKFYINYSYDGAGNLQNKYEQALDPNYGYPTGTQNGNTYEYTDTSWKDKLTKINGDNITYDANGNPLTYRDGMSMTWKNGRQLATFTNGDTSISYGYDSDSVRTTKTVNGIKYTYAYLNGQLLYETRGDAKFYYSYDTNGILYNVRYTLTDGGTEYSYYYTHNSRGDIVGIYNGAGELKAHYEYDAWGNVISITDNNGNAITNPNHIGNLNPFRYRGYYQDTETGLYYLMSRYYDAVTHRFINADGYFQSGTSILEANTFAYCGNNPVSHSDTNGNSWFSNIVSTVMGMLLNVVKKALFPFVSTRTSTTSSYNNNYKLIPNEHSAINFSTGIKTTTKTSTEGYSPGLISCSYNQDAYTYSDNASGLSAGVTNTISVNAFIFGAGVNFGDDGWGLDFSINLGNTSFYASYNKHNPLDNELQIGYTMWDKSNSSSVSNYVSGSVNSFKLSPAVAATLMLGPVVGLAAAAVI